MYKKVCSDFSAQGCCDADCCSDFEPKVDFLHLKHHIGDRLYDVANNTIVTYTISSITFLDGDVRYELTSDNLRAQRTHIWESEISSVFLDYDSAAAQLNPEVCESCFHHSVCNQALISVPAPLCKHYVRSYGVTIYPCSVGQEFYVVQPAAHKFNIRVPCPITRYIVDHIYVSHYSSCLNEVIVLHDDQDHWISISSFDDFKQILGRVFFDTREAAEEELRSYIFSTDQEG